jgi:hypothetical protein
MKVGRRRLNHFRGGSDRRGSDVTLEALSQDSSANYQFQETGGMIIADSVILGGEEISFRVFLEPTTTAGLTGVIAEFYSRFPLVFTPIQLQANSPDKADFTKVSKYLKLRT